MTLVIFLLSSFAGSLIGMTGWRLWTQLSPNQQAEHQVSDDLPDADCWPVAALNRSFHSTFVSPEAQQDHD